MKQVDIGVAMAQLLEIVRGALGNTTQRRVRSDERFAMCQNPDVEDGLIPEAAIEEFLCNARIGTNDVDGDVAKLGARRRMQLSFRDDLGNALEQIITDVFADDLCSRLRVVEREAREVPKIQTG